MFSFYCRIEQMKTCWSWELDFSLWWKEKRREIVQIWDGGKEEETCCIGFELELSGQPYKNHKYIVCIHIYIYFLFWPLKLSKWNDTTVAINISDVQILVSKDYSPIERSQDFLENVWFQVWSRERERWVWNIFVGQKARKCSHSKRILAGDSLTGLSLSLSRVIWTLMD